eukprot:scaffold51061_cov23-Tisochrysis_lutea.AAC.1
MMLGVGKAQVRQGPAVQAGSSSLQKGRQKRKVKHLQMMRRCPRTAGRTRRMRRGTWTTSCAASLRRSTAPRTGGRLR